MFEATQPDGLAWMVSLTLVPHRRTAWYWSMVHRPGEPLLHVADLEVRIPKARLEIRSDALWADHICETPFDHWTVANELMAVALDDPQEALRSARGDLQPMAIDAEWEADGAVIVLDGDRTAGYEVQAISHGELHLGSGTPGDVDKIALDGVGRWVHRWGPWAPPAPVDEPLGYVLLDALPARNAVAARTVIRRQRVRPDGDGAGTPPPSA
jgi:hypothetical protein